MRDQTLVTHRRGVTLLHKGGKVKLFFSSLLVLLPLSSFVAQRQPQWQRAYTFDDSFIDLNTNVIIGGEIGRATFRWVFDRPEPLSRTSNLSYKSRLETVEFRCADKLYRMYAVAFLDSSEKTIYTEEMKSPYEWHRLKSDGPMATILAQACRLIDGKMNFYAGPITKSADELELNRAILFFRSIKATLERSRDFQPIINQFFAPNFINRYLDDPETNWFYNLDQSTAAKASYPDLKRFYTALLNAGYLTSLYLISQASPPDDDGQMELVPNPQVVPADIYQLINNHPYTARYKSGSIAYDYLAEKVDTVDRMRTYTDLLEKIARLMRKHVAKVQAERSPQYKNILEQGDLTSRVCTNDYLGLPKGTKLFEITLPALRLEAADLNGRLRIVSVRESSQ